MIFGGVHNNVLNDCNILETHHSESCASLRDINEFVSLFAMFIV